MFSVRSSSNSELFIAIIEILLRKIEPVKFQHAKPNRGRRTICGNDYAGIDINFAAGSFVSEASGPGMQIEPQTTHVEIYFDAALLGFVHERGVQVCAGD